MVYPVKKRFRTDNVAKKSSFHYILSSSRLSILFEYCLIIIFSENFFHDFWNQFWIQLSISITADLCHALWHNAHLTMDNEK